MGEDQTPAGRRKRVSAQAPTEAHTARKAPGQAARNNTGQPVPPASARPRPGRAPALGNTMIRFEAPVEPPPAAPPPPTPRKPVEPVNTAEAVKAAEPAKPGGARPARRSPVQPTLPLPDENPPAKKAAAKKAP